MRIRSEKGMSLVICGLGAIGSNLAPMLARNSAVTRIVLVDHGKYDQSNLPSQNIVHHEQGKPKPLVMAKRLCALRKDLEIDCFLEPIENIPLGKLRADAFVSSCDNRATRQYMGQLSWRLGAPLIDTAVDADSLVVRLNVYVPGADRPCIECAFGEADYALLETTHPCGVAREAPPTDAPAELGALVASLAAIEIRKLLNGEEGFALTARQLIIDARHHQHLIARLPVNPHCRFDHVGYRIEALEHGPDDMTIGESLALHPGGASNGRAALQQEGATFIRRLTCVACGLKSPAAWKLSGRLPHETRCRSCGARCIATGLDAEHELRGEVLSEPWLNSPLSRLGFRAHDVFSVANGQKRRHYELGD